MTSMAVELRNIKYAERNIYAYDKSDCWVEETNFIFGFVAD